MEEGRGEGPEKKDGRGEMGNLELEPQPTQTRQLEEGKEEKLRKHCQAGTRLAPQIGGDDRGESVNSGYENGKGKRQGGKQRKARKQIPPKGAFRIPEHKSGHDDGKAER